MGCCNSNIRQPRYTDIPVEERMIQTGERQLFFNSRSLTDLQSTIESLSNDDLTSLESICTAFKVQTNSSSGLFLANLQKNNYLNKSLLNSVSILLSQGDDKKKLSLVYSRSHSFLIETINDLINIAIDIIPKHLDGLEMSALLYAKSLAPIAKQFVSFLSELNVNEIQRQLEIISVSSKEIRMKMFVELENSKGNSILDAKLDRFADKDESKIEEFKSCDEGGNEEMSVGGKFKGVEEVGVDGDREDEGSRVLVDQDDYSEVRRDGNVSEDKVLEENESDKKDYIEKAEEPDLELEIEIPVKPKSHLTNEENISEIEINIDLNNAEKLSQSELTPATNLNDEIELPKSPSNDLDSKPSDSPFDLAPDVPQLENSSEIESKLSESKSIPTKVEEPPPKPAPRKSSGLAAKLKAAQAFIATKDSSSGALVSDINSPIYQGISITKNDEYNKRNSLNSPKGDLSSSAILRSSTERNNE